METVILAPLTIFIKALKETVCGTLSLLHKMILGEDIRHSLKITWVGRVRYPALIPPFFVSPSPVLSRNETSKINDGHEW